MENRERTPDALTLVGDGPLVYVDDNEMDLVLLERCFSKSRLVDRYELICLDRVSALMELLDEVERGTRPCPSGVLLDINMPVQTGFDAVRLVRARPRFADVPILMMLTNSDSKSDIDQAFELGADGYQNKPMRMDDLVTFLDGLLP